MCAVIVLNWRSFAVYTNLNATRVFQLCAKVKIMITMILNLYDIIFFRLIAGFLKRILKII